MAYAAQSTKPEIRTAVIVALERFMQTVRTLHDVHNPCRTYAGRLQPANWYFAPFSAVFASRAFLDESADYGKSGANEGFARAPEAVVKPSLAARSTPKRRPAWQTR